MYFENFLFLIVSLLCVEITCVEIVPTKKEPIPKFYGNITEELPNSKKCPVPCFISTEEKHAVECAKNDTVLSKIPSNLTCSMNANGHVKLGKKEGIKRIVPGALGYFMSQITDKLNNFGTRILFKIQLNLMEISANTFAGITVMIKEVSIFNTFKVHPDAFIDLHHLQYLEFQSLQTPVLLLDDGIRAQSLYGLNDSLAENRLPSFIRLSLLDEYGMVGFNLPVYCHTCPAMNSNGSYLVVVFRQKKVSSGKSLTWLYPSSCPVKYNGIGCPKGVNMSEIIEDNGNSSYAAFIPGISGKNSDDVELEDVYKDWSLVDKMKDDHENHFSRLRFTLIFLTLWCALITILVLFIMFFVCMRRRRVTLKRNDDPIQRKNLRVATNRSCLYKFYNRISWLSSGAEEECKSMSTSSGFYTPSNHPGEQRSSWNPNRHTGNGNGRSNSIGGGPPHPPSPGYKPRIRPNGTPVLRRSRQDLNDYPSMSSSYLANSKTRLYPSNPKLDKSVPLVDNLLLSNGNYQLPPIPPHQGQKARLNIIEQV